MYTYNEAILWKNKYEALKEQYDKIGNTLKHSVEDTLKLTAIINIVRLKDFTDEFKIELIKNELKRDIEF